MNRLERIIDLKAPGAALRLRLVKKRLQHDWTLRILQALVSPGDTVVDVGANRGVYTLALARRVGATGRVHAVDPFPVNTSSLERLRMSRPSVVVHALALSDRPGSATMYVPLHQGRRIDALASLAAAPSTAHEVCEVQVATLDGILEGEASPASFVKCDVEGHEDSVLEGGREILSRTLPSLFLEIEQRHRRTPVQDVFDRLASWGYRGHALGQHGLMPLELFDVERDQLRHLPDGFVPYEMPACYVGDFLFTHPRVDLSRLLGSRPTG